VKKIEGIVEATCFDAGEWDLFEVLSSRHEEECYTCRVAAQGQIVD